MFCVDIFQTPISFVIVIVTLSWLTFLLVFTETSCCLLWPMFLVLSLELPYKCWDCTLRYATTVATYFCIVAVIITNHLHVWCSIIKIKKCSSFMFCWLYISIYSFKGKPTRRTIYLQYISSNTSTCFGRIYSPSSGGTPYGYNSKYQLFYPYGVPPDDGL